MSGRGGGREGNVRMRLLLRTIKPYRALVAATLAALLLDVAGTLYVPTMLAGMINQGVTSGNTDFIIGQGLKMLVACCCASGGALLGNYLCARLASYVGRDIRNAVYDASLTYSGGDFEEFGTGSMITRTLNDVNVIQQTVMLATQAMLPVPIICVMGTVLSFRVDAQMGAMMLAVVSVVMVFAVIAVRRAAPIFEKMQGFIDRMNVVLRENIIGVRVIRAFGKERHEEGRMGRVFTDYADAAIKVNWIFAGVDCFSFCLMNIAEVLLMWLGGNRVGAHAMEIGNISAVVEYAMLIMFYIMMAQFVALMVPRAIVCLQRCAEVIEKKPSIVDGTGTAPLAPGPNGEVAAAGEDGVFNASLSDTVPVATFDHVSFRFPDADEDTLHDIDFSCRRGQTTAIIGSTGSGKSTIAKMLLRLRRHGRLGAFFRRRCALHDPAQPARAHRLCAAEGLVVLGHNRQQLARWPCRCDRDRDAPRPRRGPIRLCVGPARAPGRPGCPGRHEFLRRPAPAPGHRPRPHEARGPLYLR